MITNHKLLYLFISFIITSLFFSQACNFFKKSPIQIVESYLNAKTINERFEYVLQDPGIYDLMKLIYQDTEFPVKFEKISKLTSDGIFPIKVEVVFNEELNDIPTYYLVEFNNKYRIDWKSSLFYSPNDSSEDVARKYVKNCIAYRKSKYNLDEIMNFLYPSESLAKKFESSKSFMHIFNVPTEKDKPGKFKNEGLLPGGKVELVNFLSSNDQVIAQFYLTKYQDGYKILWEPTAMYNPISFTRLKATMPKGSYQMRVIAKMDDYYNWEYLYMDNSHYSIQLWEIGGDESIHGYIEKKSSSGKILLELLGDGGQKFITLELQYNKNPEHSSCININKLVSENIY